MIGIGIKVNTSELDAAISSMGKLAELKKQAGGDINVPIELTSSIGAVRDGHIGNSTDKAARSAGLFRREMEATRKATSDVARDFDKLIKIGAGLKGSRPDTFGATSSQVSSAESARMRREAAREAAAFWASFNSSTTPPRETAAQAYYRQHGNLGNTVTSRDDDGTGSTGAGRRSSGSPWMRRALGWGTAAAGEGSMRRALGWGAAAAGVGSIAGYIGSARSAYRSALDEEQPLFARGIRGSRKRAGVAIGIGISPSEYFGLEDQLSRTGLNEKNGLARSAMLSATFAKANGVDVSEVAGFRKDIYGVTGNAGSLPDRLLTQIGKGLDKSRMFELMKLVSQNTHVTAASMHGAAISNSQTAGATALSEMALKTGGAIGTYAKSQDFAGVMQNGLLASNLFDLPFVLSLSKHERKIDANQIVLQLLKTKDRAAVAD